MAPRRGGGSSGGSSISASCPNPFQYNASNRFLSTPIVYFIAHCLFFVLTLIVLISMCCIRKRHGKQSFKKLVGPAFLTSLLFVLTGYALLIIATMLRECGTTDVFSYYNWAIVFIILFRFADYLLLIVLVWNVSSLIHARLGSGRHQLTRRVNWGILAFMGLLTGAYTGLQAYNMYTFTPAGLESNNASKGIDEDRFAVAYYVFYMLSVIVGGGMSLFTLIDLRTKNPRVGNLIGGTAALTFCMFLWTLFSLVVVALSLSRYDFDSSAYEAFEYVICFFQTFSYVAVLFLAKSFTWDSGAAAIQSNGYYSSGDANAYAHGPVEYAPVPLHPVQPQPQPQPQQYQQPYFHQQPYQQQPYQQQPHELAHQQQPHELARQPHPPMYEAPANTTAVSADAK